MYLFSRICKVDCAARALVYTETLLRSLAWYIPSARACTVSRSDKLATGESLRDQLRSSEITKKSLIRRREVNANTVRGVPVYGEEPVLFVATKTRSEK